jgi:cobalt-zinc-cadmium efflux system protein
MHVPPGPMLLAAFGGLVTEFISIKLLYSGQKGDLNLKVLSGMFYKPF